MSAIALQRKPEILTRIANGEYSTEIAESLGLERSAVSQRLRNDPEYQLARRIGKAVQIEQVHKSVRDAEGDVNLARAREAYARRVEWSAEREFPDQWGQKNQSISVVVQVSADELVGSAEDLLRNIAAKREKVVEGVTNLQVLESKE